MLTRACGRDDHFEVVDPAKSVEFVALARTLGVKLLPMDAGLLKAFPKDAMAICAG